MLPALALVGCAAVPPPVTGQPPLSAGTTGNTCSNANLQQFVGQAATTDLGARMLQVSGATTIRWVPQGTAVTMLFQAGRLTVFLDAQNRVERLSCS